MANGQLNAWQRAKRAKTAAGPIVAGERSPAERVWRRGCAFFFALPKKKTEKTNEHADSERRKANMINARHFITCHFWLIYARAQDIPATFACVCFQCYVCVCVCVWFGKWRCHMSRMHRKWPLVNDQLTLVGVQWTWLACAQLFVYVCVCKFVLVCVCR